MLKKRQREVLFLLHGNQGYTSAESIAEVMGCSVKTIRNDLQAIRAFLEEGYHSTIVAKPNQGVRLAAGDDAWEKIRADFDASEGGENRRATTGMEEKYRIAILLLQKGSATLRDIEQLLYVSRSVAEKRLDEAQEWLAAQGVPLLRKRGAGIRLGGTAFARAIALWRLWAQGLLAQGEASITQPGGFLQSSLTSFFPGFSAVGVEEAILAIEKELCARLTFESYARLLFLTSLTMYSHRQKRPLDIQLQTLSIPYSEQEEEKTGLFAALLEERYRARLSGEERAFLAFLLGICEPEARSVEDASPRFVEDGGLLAASKGIIHAVGEAMGIDFAGDVLLRESLPVTLRSLIRWNCQGIHLEAPGIAVLREQYTDIFLAAQFAARQLEEAYAVKLTPQEICLMALHFAGALHRGGAEVRIAVMCNYGIGFSQLLKDRIEQELVGCRVVAQGSMRDLQQIRGQGFDLLVSTVPIAKGSDGPPIVCVDPFLMQFDINLIREKVEAVRRARRGGSHPVAPARLFLPEHCYVYPPTTSKEELLSFACGELLRHGMVSEGYHASLLSREEAGSSFLKDCIAIPHGKPSFVQRSAIAVVLLKKPLVWDATHKAELVFVLALNQEESPEARAAIKRFYRYISRLLSAPEEVEALRKAKNAQTLADALQDALDQA